MGFTAGSKKLGIALVMNRLAETKPFDKITVNDICNETGIGRTTFYRMCDDTYSIPKELTWTFMNYGIFKIGTEYTAEDGLRQSVEPFELFRPLFRAFWKTPDEFFSHELQQVYLRFYETVVKGRGKEFDETLRFQAQFYSEMEMNMLRYWIEGKAARSAAEQAKENVRSMPAELKQAVDIPESLVAPRKMEYVDVLMALSASDGPVGPIFPTFS